MSIIIVMRQTCYSVLILILGAFNIRTVSSSFYLGANTPLGFYSLFDELYSPDDGWRMYIIKGGPGTGKSTLMKKVAAECDRRGLYCERIFCSSDPESLDAVIVPSLKVSIADGTSPHTIEPKYPGAVEKTLDLGRFRNDGLLRENREEIIELTKENSLRHKKCVDFLSAAKSAKNDTSAVALSAMKLERLHKFSEKLAVNKLKGFSDDEGHIKKRFLSAVTPKGFGVFYDTFADLCENRVVLNDPFGCAAGVIIKILSMRAAEQGLECIMCYCTQSPEFSPEHLIIPSLSLGFFTSNTYHSAQFDSMQKIDCSRFFNSEMLSRHKNRLAFNKRTREDFLAAAVSRLSEAKEIHDRLEKYYVNAMDYDGLNEYSEKVIRDIFESC